MSRTFRKLDRADFLDRIDSVNRSYVRRTPMKYRRDRKGEKPVFFALVSFVWTWAALFVAMNRTVVEMHLGRSKLTLSVQTYALEAMAALLMLSTVALGYHFVKAVLRGRGYYNSGGVLAGFMLAAAGFFAPPEFYRSAFDLLSPETRGMVLAAADQARAIGFDALGQITR